MGHFELSQRVKAEIEADDELMSRLSSHLSESERLPVQAAGNDHRLYLFGRTRSGLYLSIRQAKGIEDDVAPLDILRFEDYSTTAAQLIDSGHKAPNFCVGVVKGRVAQLIVEDFSEGGRIKIEDGPRNVFHKSEFGVATVDGVEQTFYYDFADDWRYGYDDEMKEFFRNDVIPGETLTYFHPNARINIPLR